MKAKKTINIILNVLKIIIIILYILFTMYLIYNGIISRQADLNSTSNVNNENMLLFFTILVLLIGLIFYAALSLVSCVCLIISITFKNLNNRKSNIIIFSVLLILIILTYIIIFFVAEKYT